jgi:hypothetical protein
MKDLLTHCPPTLRRADGELVITTTFELDGETYSVSAPIGDGRYHAQRVHELIIAPALGRHPLDGRAPFAPVDDPNAV